MNLIEASCSEEPLAKLPSHSPLALAWGWRSQESSNRFNGFRKIRVFRYKPLKRLTAFPSRPKPQAEAWGE